MYKIIKQYGHVTGLGLLLPGSLAGLADLPTIYMERHIIKPQSNRKKTERLTGELTIKRSPSPRMR
jgi:hypothetical protein